jgi:6-phosphofructokinase 1
MNAAIRAIARTAVDKGMEVYGVQRGYAGLMEGDLIPLGRRQVGGIMGRGGTVLGSARSREMAKEEGRGRAVSTLRDWGIDALVVIGGNGSQTGAHALAQMGVNVVGVASTIDNDLAGTEITIGVDTALNIALEAIDRLKTTAASHHRAFLVEVMGRDCGYLALMSGIAGGADLVVIPEEPCSPETVARELQDAYDRGKTHALAVIAEGAQCKAGEIAAYFEKNRQSIGFDLRLSTLGHIQRGGAPTAFDRLLATRFGAAAVDALVRGEFGVMVGLRKGEVTTTSLPEVVATKKPLDLRLMELARVLSR